MNTEGEILDQLVKFAQERGGRCFAGWAENILRQHLKWHAMWSTLVYVTDPASGRVRGLICVRRGFATHLHRHWSMDMTGDALLVEQCVATRPGVVRQLIVGIQAKFPEWRTLKLMARRSKKGWEEHYYPAALVDRLCRVEEYA